MSDLVDVGTANSGQQTDNSVIDTYTGAVGLYSGAVESMANTSDLYNATIGVMTDELQSFTGPAVDFDGEWYNVDVRSSASFNMLFGNLSNVRVQSQHAIGALRRYPALAPRSYIGELYALEGMAEVMLAELYCSGIPLVDAPYGDNFRYGPGLKTADVLQHAVALFDTAIVYGQDSLPIAALARVEQGRALLDLGLYADASNAVQPVTTDATYYLFYTTADTGQWKPWGNNLQVVNMEGQNGIRWIAPTAAQQDPRVPLTTTLVEGIPVFTAPVRQGKILPSTLQRTLASGIEARLIEAEAQLQPPASPAGPWLATLNDLRARVGLADTTDPGTTEGRVDLLFHERAFWLYLTGHRQGDLRRLIRQYGRQFTQTYPVGTYPFTDGPRLYQDLATVALPPEERQYNTLYRGCFDMNP